jgi:hypothetical protein
VWKEFKQFIARGNVVDLAIGVIIGAAFGKIVTSFVNDILMPPSACCWATSTLLTCSSPIGGSLRHAGGSASSHRPQNPRPKIVHTAYRQFRSRPPAARTARQSLRLHKNHRRDKSSPRWITATSRRYRPAGKWIAILQASSPWSTDSNTSTSTGL